MEPSDFFTDMGLSAPVRKVMVSEASLSGLERISDLMAIGLSGEEMKSVSEYFRSEGREPTDIELEALGQAWSEHCCYKSSKYFMKRSFLGIDAPQKILTDQDAGVVEFDAEHAYVVGLESHNHPSAIGPYGGAATGVGGIIRDVVCMGAQPIALIDPLFFGPPDTDHRSLPEGVKHPRYIFQGVVAGIRDYGNRIGIPTVSGMINFHRGYTGNPLVNVGCVGIARKEHIIHSAVGGPGEIYILAGGRTGKDGIHGVTFASTELSSESEEKDRGSVQLGDPITKEPLIHACLELNEMGLLQGMKDLGGGGLSCVSGEMALEGGCGAIIDLDKVPLKEKGLAPWEIWVSESQERMMVSVLPENVEDVLHIFQKWDVLANVIGRVVEDKRVIALWEGDEILNMDLEFFTKGPEYCRAFIPKVVDRDLAEKKITIQGRDEMESAFKKVLSDLNIASKEMVFRTYDHEVRASTIIKPGVGRVFNPGPSDCAVMKPLEDSDRGIAITADVNPFMCEIDPYRGTLTTAEEAIRNLVSIGARPHAITDCLNFGNPEKPDRLGDFVRSCEALGKVAKKFSLPVVSGNVSLYNETEQGNVPPTPTVMMTGIVDDIDAIITSDFKEEGNIIYLVGDTKDEMGGSAYYRVMRGSSNRVPDLDLDISENTVDALLEANSSDLLMAVHDVSEGGMAVSLAEMCIGGGFGADVNVKRVGSIGERDENIELKSDVKLFSESNSRYLVEVTLPLARKFEDCLSRHEVPYTKIGTVGDGAMKISDGDDVAIDIGVDELDRIWRDALERAMGGY